jgi:hypothetical protein
MDGKTREESDTTEAMIAFSIALSHSFFSRDGLRLGASSRSPKSSGSLNPWEIVP